MKTNKSKSKVTPVKLKIVQHTIEECQEQLAAHDKKVQELQDALEQTQRSRASWHHSFELASQARNRQDYKTIDGSNLIRGPY